MSRSPYHRHTTPPGHGARLAAARYRRGDCECYDPPSRGSYRAGRSRGDGVAASGAVQLAFGLAIGVFGGGALMLLDRGAVVAAVFFGLVAVVLAALVWRLVP